MNDIPKSKFMMLIKPSNYLGPAFGTSGIRQHDQRMFFLKFPVGWVFFSNSNIDNLRRELNTDLNELHMEMVKVYESMAAESNVPYRNHAWVIKKVGELNKETRRKVSNRLASKYQGIQRYAAYRRAPNIMGANPMFLKGHKERTVALNDNEFVPQGGTFHPQTYAGKYNPPHVLPLNAYSRSR